MNYLLLTVVASREHFCRLWIYNYAVSLRIKAFFDSLERGGIGFETIGVVLEIWLIVFSLAQEREYGMNNKNNAKNYFL